MSWTDGLELGNGLDGLGAGSVYQRNTLTIFIIGANRVISADDTSYHHPGKSFFSERISKLAVPRGIVLFGCLIIYTIHNAILFIDTFSFSVLKSNLQFPNRHISTGR